MQRFHTKLLLLALLVQLPLANGQTPAGAPQQQSPAVAQPAPADDQDVVRITTNLIQFDVTITDTHGNPVPDLRPEDFEILENGKPQAISNFSYISLAPIVAKEPARPVNKPVDKYAPPTPAARLRPDQVRRTIALVVDDLGLSWESTAYVRQALKKFVDTQMQPGDLVAIVRTGGGVSGLQQFTTDKRLLYDTIDHLQWRAIGRSGISAFAPAAGSEAAPLVGLAPSIKSNDPASDPGEFRDDRFTIGTLGSISYIVNGLRDLPGRKSVILMSEGFQLIRKEGKEDVETFERLRRLTDQANRASVVIYALDPRGLAVVNPTAEDATASSGEIAPIFAERSVKLDQTQTSLSYLAQQTGGFAVINDNDLSGGIKRIINDQSGYYLIGYHPDESTFDPHHVRYNSFQVKLKRKGLELRYRSGFYGVSDDKAKEPPKLTRPQMIQLALVSPFNLGGADLQLTSLFGNDAQAGSFVRSFVHIRTQDLTFTEEKKGEHKAVFDLLAVTFGKDDKPIDLVSRTYTVDIGEVAYQRALKTGLIYVATVPIKKAGAYQLRIAIHDVASSRVGSATQFIEIPNLKKSGLVLSGVAAFGVDATALNNKSAPATQISEVARSEEDPEAGVALRRLRSGMVLQYACYMYNATSDKASGQPQLHTQVRIFRDGQLVYAGNPAPYDAKGQADLQRLPLTGAISLGGALMPGQYVLQVLVTDGLAKEKQNVATQWIDFEIVPGSVPGS